MSSKISSSIVKQDKAVSSTDYFFERKFIPEYQKVPPFPYEVLLDVTSLCNHACTFCANTDIKLKTTLASTKTLQFIQEAYSLGTRRLGVFGTGESFLVKELADYIKLAKDIGYEYVYIKTNGALCTPERLNSVLDAGLDSLRFSIHAGSRETYKKIQGRDDFDKVMTNLKNAHDYKVANSLNVHIAVSVVLTDQGREELELLQRNAGEWVDFWDIHDLNSQCGNLLDNNEKGEIVFGGPRYDHDSGICKQPFAGLSLTPEGYISACIMDFYGDLIAGDYNKQGLKEIWEGEVFTKFRSDHLNNTLKDYICYSCIHNKENKHRPLIEEYSRKYRVEQKA